MAQRGGDKCLWSFFRVRLTSQKADQGESLLLLTVRKELYGKHTYLLNLFI